MIRRIQIFAILIMLLTHSAYSHSLKRIKVYHRLSCPVVPFATIEIKISNYQLCSRNILPPRFKMKSEQLDSYDSWAKMPKFFKMNKEDYDSIITYIENLNLMNTDIMYSDPKIADGLIMVKTGSCREIYIIASHHCKVELPIEDAYDFELPVSIEKFDLLFKRVTQRYIQPINIASR